MCAVLFKQFGQSPYGPEYDRTGKKLTKTDDRGRTLYPDSSANMHSTSASGSQQSGLKIGGPDGSSTGSYSSGRTDGLKGDAPLSDPKEGPDTSGGTGGINY